MYFSYHLCCVVSSLNRINDVARGRCQFLSWTIRHTLKVEETSQKCWRFFVFSGSSDSNNYVISSAGFMLFEMRS